MYTYIRWMVVLHLLDFFSFLSSALLEDTIFNLLQIMILHSRRVNESNLLQHLEIQWTVPQMTPQQTVLSASRWSTMDGSSCTTLTVDSFYRWYMRPLTALHIPCCITMNRPPINLSQLICNNSYSLRFKK